MIQNRNLKFLLVWVSTFWVCCALATPSKKDPELWNLSPQNPHFVGRKKELRYIAQKLQDKPPFIVLTGGTGFGKTQIVKQYAYTTSQAYDIVWWFKVDKTLSTQFETFAHALNDLLEASEQIPISRLTPEVLLYTIKARLRQKAFNSLLIFDNVQDCQTLLPYLPDTPSHRTHILVTARKKIHSYAHRSISILTRSESLLFLRRILPHEKDQKLLQLAAYLNDHPLALATGASYLSTHPSVSIAHYIQSFELQKHNDTTFVDEHEQNVYIALSITLNALKRECPETADVLKFLSLLNPSQIPFLYLEEFLKSHKTPHQTANDVLNVMYDRYSLVEVIRDDFPQNVRLSMHDLIHKVINEQIPEVEKKGFLEKAIPIVAENFVGRTDIFVQRISQTPEHLLHAQKLSEEARKLNYHTLPLLSLRIRILECLMSNRDFEGAKPLIEQIKKDQKILGQQSQNALLKSFISPSTLPPLDQAILEINLGYFEGVYAPDYEKAMVHEQKALEILRKLPNQPEETLKVVSGLIQSHIFRGELEQGERLVKEGKALLENSQAPLTNLFFIQGAWAVLLSLQGHLEQALGVLEQYQDLLKHIDFPIYVMGNLYQKAELLAKLERYKECHDVLAQIETLHREWGGMRETAPTTAAMVVKAYSNRKLKDKIPESLSLAKQAIEIFKRLFHGENQHIFQGFAYFVLGQLYETQGNTQKALEAYLTSNDVYMSVLKSKAIDDVSLLYTAIVLLGFKKQAKGRITTREKELTQIFLDRHIETFGLMHPRTVEIMKHADAHGIKAKFS